MAGDKDGRISGSQRKPVAVVVVLLVVLWAGGERESFESSLAFARVRLTLGSFRLRRCRCYGLDKGQVSFKDAAFFQAPSSACS